MKGNYNSNAGNPALPAAEDDSVKEVANVEPEAKASDSYDTYVFLGPVDTTDGTTVILTNHGEVSKGGEIKLPAEEVNRLATTFRFQKK